MPAEKLKELHAKLYQEQFQMMKINKTVFVALLLSFVFCEQPKKQVFALNASDFRTEIKGKTDIYLQSDKIQVYITNYGGRIVSLLTPDNYGEMGDVVLP